MEYLKIILVLGVLFTVCLADQATEEADNAVEIKLYRLSVDKWTSELMETKFAGVIASGANTYCEANPNDCGMYVCCSASAFKEIHIGKVADYPTNDEKDMAHKFFISMPTGSDISNSSTLRYTLSRAVVIDIIAATRITLHGEIGYYITWADDEFFGVPPPRTENIAIIIVAFAVLFIIMFIAIALHFWNKKREARQRLQKKIEKKKEQKKEKQKAKEEKEKATGEAVDGASYNIETEVKVPPVNEEKIKRSIYGDISPVKTPSKGATPASDTDSAIKMEDEPRPHALPPLHTKLITEEPVEEKKEKRRKKKKEKKHRRKRTEGDENKGYGSD